MFPFAQPGWSTRRRRLMDDQNVHDILYDFAQARLPRNRICRGGVRSTTMRMPKIPRAMKTTRLTLFCCIFLIAVVDCPSQDSTTHQTLFPSGIGIQAGVGFLSVKDEHISSEKYSGVTPLFALSWSRFHETYGFRIGLRYQMSSAIKNYNVSAEVRQGALFLDEIYPVGGFDLFGKHVFAYLGPSSDFFLSNRKQNIAQNTDANPNVYQSTVWLFSLGARTELIAPIQTDLHMVGALQVGVLSLGGGNGNSQNDTPITLLTVLAGMRGMAEIGLRYSPLSCLSMDIGYELEVTRIDSWNYFLAASDNVFASLCIQF